MKKLNITIVVLDTLRIDMFNDLIKTKGMELSKLGRFIFFDKCIAAETWTLPSFASILTGMYPSEHGAHETREIKALDIDRIKLRKNTFVSDLKALKYKTYAVSANPYFHPVYGFNEFDVFKEESYFADVWGSVVEVSGKVKPMLAKYREKYGSDLLSSMVRIPLAVLAENPNLFFEAFASGIVLTPIAFAKKLKAKVVDDWPLEKGGKKIVKTVKGMKLRSPFFLFISLMEPHDPYSESKKNALSSVTPFWKKPADKKTIKGWQKLYLRASRKGYAYSYQIIKNIIERYGDDQIIILVSDHGQEFNEHGYLGHGVMLHDEIVRVPMAVLLPKEFEAVENDDYSTFVNIKRFLFAALKGKRDAIKELYGKEVRAESFGVFANLYRMKDIDLKKLRSADKPRVRVFKS